MFSKTAILYHANCVDGFTAAWAAQRALPGAIAEPVSYNQEGFPEGLEGCVVYILDFSYSLEKIKELCKIAKAVLILDHHKSAKETLESLKPIEWNFSTEPDDISGAFAFFHMGKSGARLAWEYFHPHLLVPRLISLVEDYDLWNFKFEDTRAVHEYLSSVKQTVYHWNYANYSVVNDPDKGGIIGVGWHIYQTKMLVIEDLIKGVHIRGMDWNLPDGDRIYVAFQYAPKSLTDYTGEKLVELGHEIACLWRIDGDKVSISLRSKKGGDRDVSRIARSYGGGGHQSSAGFQIGLEDFLNWM